MISISEIVLYIALGIVGFVFVVWFVGWLARRSILLYLLFWLALGLLGGWFVGWFVFDDFTKYITSPYDPSRFLVAGLVVVVFLVGGVWAWYSGELEEEEENKKRMEEEDREEQARLKEEDREAMRELIEELKADREGRNKD